MGHEDIVEEELPIAMGILLPELIEQFLEQTDVFSSDHRLRPDGGFQGSIRQISR